MFDLESGLNHVRVEYSKREAREGLVMPSGGQPYSTLLDVSNSGCALGLSIRPLLHVATFTQLAHLRQSWPRLLTVPSETGRAEPQLRRPHRFQRCTAHL